MFAKKGPKLAHLGYALSYGVGYKAMVHRAFSERLKEECGRRNAFRGGGAAVDNRSPLGSVRDVHAGAALAVRKRL
jgi:hypothetical protein